MITENWRNTDESQNKEVLPKNVEIVERPEGRYRIVYGAHNVEQAIKDLGPNYAGVILEATSSADECQTALDRNIINVQYRKIIQDTRQRKKPIFVVDIDSIQEPLMYHFGVPMIEAVAAGGALLSKNKNTGNQKITRRDFLKKAAKIATLGYVGTDMLVGLLSSSKDNPEIAKKALHLRENINPKYMYLLALRNLIVAEKMTKISTENKEQFGGEDLVAVYGENHSDLAPVLKMSHEERMKELKRILGILPRPFTQPKDLARVLRFDFDAEQKKWQMQESIDEDIMKVAS
ncbi:MAG: hypothetical protein Q8Q17_02110 [bacterium]|nr:hypothetical protein [bacterium]